MRYPGSTCPGCEKRRRLRDAAEQVRRSDPLGFLGDNDEAVRLKSDAARLLCTCVRNPVWS